MFLQAGKISAEDVLQILRPLGSYSKTFGSIFQGEVSDAESETADLSYLYSGGEMLGVPSIEQVDSPACHI